MSTERTQTQMSNAVNAFRRAFPMFNDPKTDKESWLHERQNEILDMYLDIEKAEHAMTLHRLRLRFLANEMWYGFGSQEFNIIHKLLEHMDIIAGNLMLSQVFCAKITSVSSNIRQILMNNPFKLKAHQLKLKPLSEVRLDFYRVSKSVNWVTFKFTDSLIQAIQKKQELYEINELNIDLQKVDCKQVIAAYKTIICQCHTLTSLTLRVPSATRKAENISLNTTLFKHGLVHSAILKHLTITGSTPNPPPNLWTNFRDWALHTQLEFLHADVGFLRYRTHGQCLTSLKFVVVNFSSFVIPDFLLSAPNIRFFRVGLSLGYTLDEELNDGISRIEKYLEFLENFQHLEHLIIDMDLVVNQHEVILKVESAMAQILDKYLQRNKNKNLRRVQVPAKVKRYNEGGVEKLKCLYDKVFGETTSPIFAFRV